MPGAKGKPVYIPALRSSIIFEATRGRHLGGHGTGTGYLSVVSGHLTFKPGSWENR